MKKAKLKQSFAKAKLFEIRRLVRRIRQFSLKKGSEQQLAKNKRKVLRLENQLEILKDARFEQILEALDKNEKDQEFDEEKNDAKCQVLNKLIKAVRDEKRRLENVEERQKNRIDISKVEPNSTDSGDESDEPDTDFSESNLTLSSKKILQTDDIMNNRFEKSKVVSNISSEKNKSISDSSEEIPVSSDATSVKTSLSSNNKTKLAVGIGGKRKRNERNGKKSKMKQKKQTLHEDGIPDNVSYSSSDGEEQFDRRHLSVDSVFIGSLANGKAKQDGKNRNKDIKKKRNRVGQRQRKEQWKKLYGHKANHLKSEKRKEKMVERKDKSSSQKNGDFSKKKATTKDTTVLHPSWEASKSKRKQETIVAFEGKKITFDD